MEGAGFDQRHFVGEVKEPAIDEGHRKRGFAASRGGGQKNAACTGSDDAGVEVKQEIVTIDGRLPQGRLYDRCQSGKPVRATDWRAVPIDVAPKMPVAQQLGAD